MSEIPPEQQRELAYKDFVRRAELFANTTLKESFVDYIEMLHDPKRYTLTGMSSMYMSKLLPARYHCTESKLLASGLGVKRDSIYNFDHGYIPIDHSVSGGEKDFSFKVDMSYEGFIIPENNELELAEPLQPTEPEPIVLDAEPAVLTSSPSFGSSRSEHTPTQPSPAEPTSDESTAPDQMTVTYMEGRRDAMLMAFTAMKIVFEVIKSHNECLETLQLPMMVESDSNSVVCCIKDSQFPKFAGLFYVLEIVNHQV